MARYLYPLENVQQLFRLLNDVENAAVWAPAGFDCRPLTDGDVQTIQPTYSQFFFVENNIYKKIFFNGAVSLRIHLGYVSAGEFDLKLLQS